MGRLSQAASVALVLVALLACKKDKKEISPVAEVSAAPVASGPCPSGRSEDPGAGEFRPAATAFLEQKDYKAAQALLETLSKKYPNSAKVLVWRGDAVFYEKETDANADAGLVQYEAALKLHDSGCKLEPVEEYYLRLGMALAYLRKKDGTKAKTQMDASIEKWSNSAQSYYVRARAECRADDLDSCATDFDKTLDTAKKLQRPTFLRTHYSLDDWIRKSTTQSEFAKLRVDKRYSAAVKKAKE